MRIGVLTGGGDCPGVNAVIRAIVRSSVNAGGHEIVGFADGWSGLLAGTAVPLTYETTRGILHRGGTILGCSRTDPRWLHAPPSDLAAQADGLGLDALIAIGGDGTLRVADGLHKIGVPVVGVPKTIDNDLAATDVSFGFDTAVQVATDAIDRLHTTAESHRRVFAVEVMGRHSGWIALHAGIAGGADAILVPEWPVHIGQVCERIQARARAGCRSSVIVVAEGVRLKSGVAGPPRDPDPAAEHGGVVYPVARELQHRTGIETRALVLGHLQRGGTPTASDRLLATRLGIAAFGAAATGTFGHMPALRGTRIELVSLSAALASARHLGSVDLALAEAVFGLGSDPHARHSEPPARGLVPATQRGRRAHPPAHAIGFL